MAEKELMVELETFFLGFLVGCSQLVAESFLVLFGVDSFGVCGGYEGFRSLLSIIFCATCCGNITCEFVWEA